MAKQILVPLSGGDRIDEILPYLQDITRHGTTVVFLVPFGSSRFSELASQLLMINSGHDTMLVENHCREKAAKMAQRISAGAEKLRQRRVEIKTTFYTGPLQRVLRQFVRAEADKCLILRPVRNYLARCWQAIASVLGIAATQENSSIVSLSSLTASIRK